ncbi:MAG: FkbM family methyltransferase [Terrimicrobiaceae bacterium]|nr:FkbM family methyltransferase [Terrimicrobiaceae bacterium]
MRNPIFNAARALTIWRRLRRRAPFGWADAFTQFHYVLLPTRLQIRVFAAKLPKRAAVRAAGEQFLVEAKEDGIAFYWPTLPGADVSHLLDTLVNGGNPHCYLVPPVRLEPGGRILDVGACEGAFALFCCRRDPTVTAWCFEPNGVMADLIERAAMEQDFGDRIHVIRAGCGQAKGEALFDTRDTAGGVITMEGVGEKVPMIALDDFLRERNIELTPKDLIKIDAEGSDVDVLEGARETISRFGPQIAVTTYHANDHADRAIDLLRELRPDYQLRLRGFSFWTQAPRPVLLLASILHQ